jgi:hypothetical protein
MKTTTNKDFRFLTVIVIFVIAFVIGYLAPKDTKVVTETEYFFEKPAVVYEINEEREIVTFETRDGNLWNIEADTNDFEEGQEWVVVFNEQDEIVDLIK